MARQHRPLDERACARDIAAGLAHALAALRSSGLEGWVLRVSAADDCELVITVEKDHGATDS